MYEYGDNDFMTPNLLFEETVVYARMILDDLQRADMVRNPRQWNPEVVSVGVQCALPGSAYYGSRKLTEDMLVNRESYQTTHPAIVDAVYHRLIKKLMERAGFNDADPVNTRKRVSDFLPNDFAIGGTRGVTSISSVHICCHTPPERLRQALTVNNEDLERLCLETLQESFAAMGAFRKRSSGNQKKPPSFGLN